MKKYYVNEKNASGSEFQISSSLTLQEAIRSAQDEWNRMCESDKKNNKIYVCKYTNGTIEEIEESGSNCWDYDTYTWGLVNREKIESELCDILAKFESDRLPYQRDIYLYVDAYGNGKLEIYDNVGGNNYRNDDHYTIYSSRQYAKSEIFNVYDSVKSIADDLEIDKDELRKLAGIDEEVSDLEALSDVQEYVTSNADLSEKLDEAYAEYCKDYDWSDEVNRIIDEWYEQIMRDAEKTDAEA